MLTARDAQGSGEAGPPVMAKEGGKSRREEGWHQGTQVLDSKSRELDWIVQSIPQEDSGANPDTKQVAR